MGKDKALWAETLEGSRGVRAGSKEAGHGLLQALINICMHRKTSCVEVLVGTTWGGGRGQGLGHQEGQKPRAPGSPEARYIRWWYWGLNSDWSHARKIKTFPAEYCPTPSKIHLKKTKTLQRARMAYRALGLHR